MEKRFTKRFTIGIVGAAVLGLFVAIAQSPPPLPPSPTGSIQLAWSYDTNSFGVVTLTNTSPNAGTSVQTFTNQIVFTLYASPDLSNWTPIMAVTNALSATISIVPIVSRFVSVTASNITGESRFSSALWIPALPPQGSNLVAKRI